MWGSKMITKTGFGKRSTAEQVTEGIDGSGLTAIVTGGTNGIGKETVRVLAKRGVHVFLAARNLEAAEKVKEGVVEENPNAKVDLLELDLSSLSSVRKAAEDFLALNVPLNILVNNAGIMCVPFQLTQDGIELQFATNYVGHFLLTNLLLETLKRTAKESGIEGRVINVSSVGHYLFEYEGGIRFDKLNEKEGYNEYRAYGQSKLAQVLSTTELSRRLQEEGAAVTVNVLHPGAVNTNLINTTSHSVFQRAAFVLACWLVWPLSRTIPQGAATSAFLAMNPLAKGLTGQYFYDCNAAEMPSKFVKDGDLAKRLWDFSVQLTSY